MKGRINMILIKILIVELYDEATFNKIVDDPTSANLDVTSQKLESLTSKFKMVSIAPKFPFVVLNFNADLDVKQFLTELKTEIPTITRAWVGIEKEKADSDTKSFNA